MKTEEEQQQLIEETDIKGEEDENSPSTEHSIKVCCTRQSLKLHHIF